MICISVEYSGTVLIPLILPSFLLYYPVDLSSQNRFPMDKTSTPFSVSIPSCSPNSPTPHSHRSKTTLPRTRSRLRDHARISTRTMTSPPSNPSVQIIYHQSRLPNWNRHDRTGNTGSLL